MTVATFSDLLFKGMNAGHRLVLLVSGGRLLKSPFGVPGIELTTKGRKTGRSHKTLLIAPIMDERRVVLVASKGGDPDDPQWFKNLVAHPEVEARVLETGEVRDLRARVASPEEKEAMWPAVVAAYKGYAEYQKRTQRDIPVVILEP